MTKDLDKLDMTAHTIFQACVLGTPALGAVDANSGVYVRYWDEGATAAVLEFAVAEPAAAEQSKEGKAKEKKKKAKGTFVRASTLNAGS